MDESIRQVSVIDSAPETQWLHFRSDRENQKHKSFYVYDAPSKQPHGMIKHSSYCIFIILYYRYINGLVQHCGISSALALEIPQYSAKPHHVLSYICCLELNSGFSNALAMGMRTALGQAMTQ